MHADSPPLSQSPVQTLRLQIVPPGPGGVHDFASALRAEWAMNGNASELLAIDRAAVRVRSLTGVLMTLQGGRHTHCSVLLHFSGYGYDKRGLCTWLLHALRDAQQRLGPRLRIVTLFHELSATSPPWQSAFWLGPLQARIARQLAALSAAVVTNTAQHAQWLRTQAGLPAAVRGSVQVRPVFSNFPQPLRLPAIAAREPALIVFGSAATRARALRRLSAHSGVLQALGIEGLTEVGPGAPAAQASYPWPRRHLGTLSPPEVSQQLLRHRYALIDYPAPCLAKSSVLAAYAAHGCAVLNTADSEPDADGLCVGRHYAALTDMATAPESASAWQGMADALSGWHAGHPLLVQARELGDLLDPILAGHTQHDPLRPHPD